jgi:intraflagellar transport protein 46
MTNLADLDDLSDLSGIRPTPADFSSVLLMRPSTPVLAPETFSPRPESRDPLADFELPKRTFAKPTADSFNASSFGAIGRPRDTSAPVVSDELAELFSFCTNFQLHPIEIPPHCFPFLPDLVPSIGAIDAFIKVPRPDGVEDPLGLTVLDEPTIACSNPQILKMHLREQFGLVSGDAYLGALPEKHEQRRKALDAFLASYDEIARARPAPTMAYTYRMPEIEELMQEWPEDMAGALATLPLPGADIDLSLEEYARVLCAFLDIPVKGNIVESLHVFFTLYQRFGECGYFTNAANP